VPALNFQTYSVFLEILVPSVRRIRGMEGIVKFADVCCFHDTIACAGCYLAVHSSTVISSFNKSDKALFDVLVCLSAPYRVASCIPICIEAGSDRVRQTRLENDMISRSECKNRDRSNNQEHGYDKEHPYALLEFTHIGTSLLCKLEQLKQHHLQFSPYRL